MAEAGERKRLHRMLKRDLGPAVRSTGRGTWATTSGLPHEIRLHEQSGMTLVRVSAGMVVDVKPTKALLRDLNELNVERALSRRIVVDGKVLVVGELPVASVRKGDLEQLVSLIFCSARLDAPVIARHGGRSVTDPPASPAPDLDRELGCWGDVLMASRTATERELAVWLDDAVGCDCWIDRDEDSVCVVIDGIGTSNDFPLRLTDLLSAAQDLQAGAEED
jgi:hypothetical protein